MEQQATVKDNPVSSDQYDEEWIASAWGTQGNEKILTGAELHPRPRVSRALELMDIQPGQKVLDIACGRGEVPVLCAERGAHAVGIDFSAASLRFAALVSSARGKLNSSTGSVALIRADATMLPFADESFDRISMLDIIEHLTPNQLAMSC